MDEHGAPETVEECDKAIDDCRRTIPLMYVSSSEVIVRARIDELLELRLRLARIERAAARALTRGEGSRGTAVPFTPPGQAT